MLAFTKYSKWYFIITGAITATCIFSWLYFGLDLGIDFTGGSVLKFEYVTERPKIEDISQKLAAAGLTKISFKEEGTKGVIIKTGDITEEQRKALYETFYNDSTVNRDALSFDKIGSMIGGETKRKSMFAVILSLIAIIIYIAVAFKKVSRPVKSWKYGIVTLLMLCHDILLPIGIMAFLGRFFGHEFTIPILTALLTVLGASVNNSIVVFDRVRENLTKASGTFKEIVDTSINQTFTRCLNSSLTALFPLLAIYFWGGQSLKDFALVLMLGIIAGLYSAVLLAGPILVKWHEWHTRKA